jgi:hypothetical protein
MKIMSGFFWELEPLNIAILGCDSSLLLHLAFIVYSKNSSKLKKSTSR